MSILNFKDLRNNSKYEFTDISTEEFRIYEFLDYKVKIEEPIALAVSSSGHRILDAGGISHYIPNGWKHLYWEAKYLQPHFVK